MNKIKMPAKLLKKWLKALRSGTYIQARETLYDPSTGGFCCLGVLQHVQSGGSCEVNKYGDGFRGDPSDEWCQEAGISFNGHMYTLMEMNDGDPYSNRRAKKFTTIANYIEKNTETF